VIRAWGELAVGGLVAVVGARLVVEGLRRRGAIRVLLGLALMLASVGAFWLAKLAFGSTCTGECSASTGSLVVFGWLLVALAAAVLVGVIWTWRLWRRSS
jgi:hypothetical protein